MPNQQEFSRVGSEDVHALAVTRFHGRLWLSSGTRGISPLRPLLQSTPWSRQQGSQLLFLPELIGFLVRLLVVMLPLPVLLPLPFLRMLSRLLRLLPLLLLMPLTLLLCAATTMQLKLAAGVIARTPGTTATYPQATKSNMSSANSQSHTVKKHVRDSGNVQNNPSLTECIRKATVLIILYSPTATGERYSTGVGIMTSHRY